MRAVMMLSREVRRVPIDYEHPKRERFQFTNGEIAYVETWQPVFDRFYVPAVREWLAGWEAWQTSPQSDCSFEDWEGPGPDPDFHYPGERWPDGAEMGICMYESVSEGTPISKVYPNTDEGRRAMADELGADSYGVTRNFTAADWLEVIEGQMIMGTDIATGEIVRSGRVS